MLRWFLCDRAADWPAILVTGPDTEKRFGEGKIQKFFPISKNSPVFAPLCLSGGFIPNIS